MCRSFFVLCCRFGQLCYQSELNRQTECPLLRKAIIRKRYFLFIINKCLLSLLDDLCLWSSLLFTCPPITHTHTHSLKWRATAQVTPSQCFFPTMTKTLMMSIWVIEPLTDDLTWSSSSQLLTLLIQTVCLVCLFFIVSFNLISAL